MNLIKSFTLVISMKTREVITVACDASTVQNPMLERSRHKTYLNFFFFHYCDRFNFSFGFFYLVNMLFFFSSLQYFCASKEN